MMTGLMFHHFHGGDIPPGQGSLSADDLRRILDVWAPRLRPAKDARDHPEDGGAVLTFDDGLWSQYVIARPVLQEYGLTAMWFVPTAPLVGVRSRYAYYHWARTTQWPSVEAFYDALRVRHGLWAPPDYLAERRYLSDRDRAFRYWRDVVVTPAEYETVMDAVLAEHGVGAPPPLFLTREQVRALADAGHVVGTHSHSHPMVMLGLTPEQQEVEYATATWILGQVTGTRPCAMSHPCNLVTAHGLRTLRDLGYTLGFRAVPEGRADDPLLCPRLNAADLRRDA